nr:hypothetical protein [Tanacetum cinerariifolium]
VPGICSVLFHMFLLTPQVMAQLRGLPYMFRRLCLIHFHQLFSTNCRARGLSSNANIYAHADNDLPRPYATEIYR